MGNLCVYFAHSCYACGEVACDEAIEVVASLHGDTGAASWCLYLAVEPRDDSVSERYGEVEVISCSGWSDEGD